MLIYTVLSFLQSFYLVNITHTTKKKKDRPLLVNLARCIRNLFYIRNDLSLSLKGPWPFVHRQQIGILEKSRLTECLLELKSVAEQFFIPAIPFIFFDHVIVIVFFIYLFIYLFHYFLSFVVFVSVLVVFGGYLFYRRFHDLFMFIIVWNEIFIHI